MEDTDVNTSNKEQGGNTVISAAAAASATTTPPTTGVLLSTATVCHILRHEFENIRKALTCSICLSTYEDPVTLSTCVHAYCAKCIQQFAANQKLASGKHHQKRSSPSCPLCQTPYTRRSIQPARDLPITVNAYKHAVRQFGLAPVKYTPTLAMTQLQDDEDFNDNVYDEQQHEQLMAARTFARVLREQQQSATGEIMTTTGAAFLLQEQEQIVAVNEQCVMGRHRNKQQQQRDDEHEEQHPTFSQIIHQAQSQEVANNGGYISEEDNFYSARLLPPTPDDPTKDQNSKPAARPSEEQPPFAADGNKSSSSMPCRRPSVAQILLQEEKQSSASMPQSQDEALTLPVEKTKTSPITNSAVQNSLQHSLPSQETASSFFQNGNNCLSQESVFERHSSQGAPPFPTPEYCSPIAASHPTQKNNDQKRAPNSSVRAMVAAMEQSNEGSSGGHHASTTISSSSRTPVSSGNKIMVGPSPLAAAMDAINTTTVLAQTPPSPPDNVNTLASKSSAKRDDKNDVSARGVDASPVVPSVEEDDTAADGRNNEKGSGAARNEVAAVEGPIRPNTTAHERPETLTVETAMDESHIDIGTGIEHTTSPVMSAGDLNVGDVVDVQSRTWPGVNQPGGVAKVTRVHKNDDDGSLFYDVLYVLDRRREKKVDAVFVSLQTEIDSATKDTSRLSCRSSSRRSPKEETIPPELRARLIAEGCDVDGEATERALARMDESSAAAAKENTVTLQENHSQTFPKKKVAPKALVESKKRKTDKQTLALKNSAAPVEPTDATRKRRKSDPTPIEAKPELPCVLPHWTDNVKCEKADNYYRRRINAAIIKGMVYLCISFLSEQEENSLKELCRQAKNTKVRIVVSDSIQPNKTTICLLPSASSQDHNLTAERRSMKAMQALLAGIPLVSPSWILRCLEQKKVVVPESSMYIRTLPTKIANSDSYKFGVAFLAAAVDYSSDFSSIYAPLRNVNVYLNGFSCQNESSFGALLRQAGADEVIVSKHTALSKLKALSNNCKPKSSSTKMVILCNDSNVKISESLELQVRKQRSKVIVVNAQWMFDSVSCGVALDPAAPYTPKDPKAKELWELTQSIKMA